MIEIYGSDQTEKKKTKKTPETGGDVSSKGAAAQKVRRSTNLAKLAATKKATGRAGTTRAKVDTLRT